MSSLSFTLLNSFSHNAYLIYFFFSAIGIRYGKYCGVGWSGCPGEKPCDDLDACCKIHDECVEKNGAIPFNSSSNLFDLLLFQLWLLLWPWVHFLSLPYIQTLYYWKLVGSRICIATSWRLQNAYEPSSLWVSKSLNPKVLVQSMWTWNWIRQYN